MRIVSRLVLEAFEGPSALHACHQNGDTSNNWLSNLYWGTREQNMQDKNAHGTNVIGSKHPNSKLDEIQVAAIKMRIGSGETLVSLAVTYGVSRETIRQIKVGKVWAHV